MLWIRVQHDVDLRNMAERGETWQMMKLRGLESVLDWMFCSTKILSLKLSVDIAKPSEQQMYNKKR